MLGGLGLAAHADVTNPNFSPANPLPGYGPVSGWTGTGATGSTTFNTTGFWNNGTLPAGITTAGFIQGDGSFSTTLSGLTPGVTYTLSFMDNARDLTGLNCCNATPSLTVLVDGTALGAATAVTAVGDSNAFHSILDLFTATSATETLAFSSTTPGGADGALLLSDVHVNVTPEPSSLMLLGTSVLGAAGLVRRRFMRS